METAEAVSRDFDRESMRCALTKKIKEPFRNVIEKTQIRSLRAGFTFTVHPATRSQEDNSSIINIASAFGIVKPHRLCFQLFHNSFRCHSAICVT